MSKASNFKLNDQISIIKNGEKVTGKLIGIDTYSLESFDGKKCNWPSYTLVSSRKDVFSRYWFVCWDESKWILWLKSKRITAPTTAKLIAAKSGIAKIEFEGDAGVSTPFAALAQYKVGKGYFCLERFSGSEAMLFTGHTITKPCVVFDMK